MNTRRMYYARAPHCPQNRPWTGGRQLLQQLAAGTELMVQWLSADDATPLQLVVALQLLPAQRLQKQQQLLLQPSVISAQRAGSNPRPLVRRSAPIGRCITVMR